MCRCKKGYIEYWYSDFNTMSAKDKLSWLKFEYPEQYKDLSKEDKKDFIKNGWCYCRSCEDEQYNDDNADELHDAMIDHELTFGN